MGDLFFFMRVMVITVVVVLLMQIRWGNQTIEHHTMNFITSSSFVEPIDDVANGAVRFIRNMWSSFTKNINTGFTNALRKENQPGSRHSSLVNLERSQEYIKEHSQKAIKSVRGQFVDETKVPGDNKRASSTGDDDALIEE